MPHSACSGKKKILFALHRQSVRVPVGQVIKVGCHTPGYQTLSDLWRSWRGGRKPHILQKRAQGGLRKINKQTPQTWPSIQIFLNTWQSEPLFLGLFWPHASISPLNTCVTTYFFSIWSFIIIWETHLFCIDLFYHMSYCFLCPHTSYQFSKACVVCLLHTQHESTQSYHECLHDFRYSSKNQYTDQSPQSHYKVCVHSNLNGKVHRILSNHLKKNHFVYPMSDIDAIKDHMRVWFYIFFTIYRSNDFDIYFSSLPLQQLALQFYWHLLSFVLQEKWRLHYACYNSIPWL